MNLDILKNPIILAALAGVSVYLYMKWDADKKAKKDPSLPKKKVNCIPALAVAVIVWFLSSSYFESETEECKKKIQNMQPERFRLTNSNSASIHLIGKRNIRVPPTDVFIDLAPF